MSAVVDCGKPDIMTPAADRLEKAVVAVQPAVSSGKYEGYKFIVSSLLILVFVSTLSSQEAGDLRLVDWEPNSQLVVKETVKL